MKKSTLAFVSLLFSLSISNNVFSGPCEKSAHATPSEFIVEGEAKNIELERALEQIIENPSFCAKYVLLWEPGIDKKKKISVSGPRYVSEMVTAAAYAAGYKIEKIGEHAFYIYQKSAPYISGQHKKQEKPGFAGFIVKPGYFSEILEAVGREWGYQVKWQPRAGLEDFSIERPIHFHGKTLQDDIATLEGASDSKNSNLRVKLFDGQKPKT